MVIQTLPGKKRAHWLGSFLQFKIRGAYNKLVSLSAAQRARGVITASAGNHAQGVALAARELGIDATIVMPATTPQLKVSGVRSRGAEALLHGESFPFALVYALELAQQTGRPLSQSILVPISILTLCVTWLSALH